MDELQNVTFTLPKAGNGGLTESFDKHPDNQEFYFDVVNGPEVDNQRWGGGIPALLSGPQANRMILQSATEAQLQQYGLDPAIKPLNMDIKLTILVSGTPVQYEVYVGDSNPMAPTITSDCPVIPMSIPLINPGMMSWRTLSPIRLISRRH